MDSWLSLLPFRVLWGKGSNAGSHSPGGGV